MRRASMASYSPGVDLPSSPVPHTSSLAWLDSHVLCTSSLLAVFIHLWPSVLVIFSPKYFLTPLKCCLERWK